jgi:hypothetical protein
MKIAYKIVTSIFFFNGEFCSFLMLSSRNLPANTAHLFSRVEKKGFEACRWGAVVLAWRLIASAKALFAERFRLPRQALF